MNALAERRALASFHLHGNAAREPEEEDLRVAAEQLGRALRREDINSFRSAWSQAMRGFQAAHEAFLAFAKKMGIEPPPGPRFERFIADYVLTQLGERIGPWQLFHEGEDPIFWKLRPGQERAQELLARVRATEVDAPVGLRVEIVGIVRIERKREKPYTAVLVTASSPIAGTALLALYAE
jgi:hypothetical protein